MTPEEKEYRKHNLTWAEKRSRERKILCVFLCIGVVSTLIAIPQLGRAVLSLFY